MTIHRQAFGMVGVCSVVCIVGLGCDSATSPNETPPDTAQVKVLFIGNSLTRNGGMTSLFEEITQGARRNILVERSAVPGASFADHAINAETVAKIEQEDWDYVVLQGSSPYVAFPEDHSEVYPSILVLEQMIRDNHSNTRIVFFMDWAYESGGSWDGVRYTYYEFQRKLRDGTVLIADSLDYIVAPVGWVWNSVRRDRPDIDLYDSDGRHPSQWGTYLQACVYFATIFQDSTTTEYRSSLSSNRAYLHSIAEDIVLNDADTWNLPR